MTAQQPAAKKPGVNTQNRKSLLRKRAARLAAVQALYSMLLEDVKTTAQKLANVILGQWEDSKADGDGALPTDAMPDKALLAIVLESALENRAKLDGAIDSIILPGWSRERTSLVLQAALMAAGAEWLASTRAAAVLVDEYVSVGTSMLAEEEVAYLHKALHVMFDALPR